MTEREPTLAFVALGSNLGSRIQHLAAGIHALEDMAIDRAVRTSSVYETDPVGYLQQGSFLNMVASLLVDVTAHEFLAKLLEIELAEGRVRTISNGPRTLDLDLLLFGEQQMSDSTLVIPHPRMHSRAFVLCPLAEIAPNLVLEGGRTVKDLAQDFALEGGIRYVGRFC